jgi:transcriptional regulator with XRE-family HTH domain
MLSQKIDFLLNRDGRSRKELAAYLGITVQAVGRYIKETADPTPENIVKIADFFNVTTDYLLRDIDSANMTSNEKIKRFIEKLGYNYRDFADDIGWPRESILKIINNDIPVSDELIRDISSKYAVPAKDFYSNVKNEVDEVEIFCSDKMNKAYIECAMKLKEMSISPQKVIEIMEIFLKP